MDSTPTAWCALPYGESRVPTDPRPADGRTKHYGTKPRKGKDPYAPSMLTPYYPHVLCVEHVRVKGLHFPVCILRGQDREKVLADVAEVMAG